ncbi:MAG: TlpA disulfide reductase family protein [Gemmatimonadota bacterium]
MRMIRRVLITAAALVVLGGAADIGFRLGTAGEGGLWASLAGSANVSKDGWLEIPSPSVEFETVHGEVATLEPYRGQIVLLNFWGTWCPPCLREIPHLVQVQKFLEAAGGTIIGPAVDSGSSENILEFAEAHGINYPVWVATYDIAVGEFGALGYPFTLLIDREGMIRKQYLGPQTSATLVADLRKLLAEEAQTVAGASSSSRN